MFYIVLGFYNNVLLIKVRPEHVAHWAALISIPVALSQTPAPPWGGCIAWCVCYASTLATEADKSKQLA